MRIRLSLETARSAKKSRFEWQKKKEKKLKNNNKLSFAPEKGCAYFYAVYVVALKYRKPAGMIEL